MALGRLYDIKLGPGWDHFTDAGGKFSKVRVYFNLELASIRKLPYRSFRKVPSFEGDDSLNWDGLGKAG